MRLAGVTQFDISSDLICWRGATAKTESREGHDPENDEISCAESNKHCAQCTGILCKWAPFKKVERSRMRRELEGGGRENGEVYLLLGASSCHWLSGRAAHRVHPVSTASLFRPIATVRRVSLASRRSHNTSPSPPPHLQHAPATQHNTDDVTWSRRCVRTCDFELLEERRTDFKDFLVFDQVEVKRAPPPVKPTQKNDDDVRYPATDKM